jgi:sulfoacetaldehyde acetyltransferase
MRATYRRNLRRKCRRCSIERLRHYRLGVADSGPKLPGRQFWDARANAARLYDGARAARSQHRRAGPGITNFVTAIKTTYWNPPPMLLVTPQAANRTIGPGGFQEVEQMASFARHGLLPGGGAILPEVWPSPNRVIEQARRLSAPPHRSRRVADAGDGIACAELSRPSGRLGARPRRGRSQAAAKFWSFSPGAGGARGAIPDCAALAGARRSRAQLNRTRLPAPSAAGPLG